MNDLLDWVKDKAGLGAVVTLALQLAAAAWWASSMSATVAAQEGRLTKIERTISEPGGVLMQISNRTARIEGQLDGISEQLRSLNGTANPPPRRGRDGQ